MSIDSATFQQSLADRYRITQELGRGGMATVFLADDLKHGRQVAIKVMLPEIAAAIGPERFLREIEIAARLSHPHILPLFDSGATAERLYYVMPFIPGESLRQRLDRDRRLPVADALRLTREIASALGHAHHQGLVHRDIKPENVLLSDGIALVADFGIARVQSRETDSEAADTVVMPAPDDATVAMPPPAASPVDSDDTVVLDATLASKPGGTLGSTTEAMTRLGTMLGTPRYMAPEQAQGSATLDGRADQYALGCVLFEMLAGQPPYSGPLSVVLHRHAHDPIPSLLQHRSDAPEGIDRVIAKALAKAPADRFATMARFAEALGLAATGGATPTLPSGAEAATPNNLPTQRTRFVGRQQELADCARLFGETRLLTLTGIGGGGKTRLALKLAEFLRASFPDGVWFVDLAPLADPERVPLEVARAMGLREEPGKPILDTITRHVAAHRTLVILDNCEHLVAASAAVADALLAAGDGIRIIVTSREILGVEGERAVGVRSLSLPAEGPAQPAEAILATDAVRLFVERAKAVVPDFHLDEASARVVAEICRRLDGIPLAIEFAAARVELLSVDQIRAKLDDRFRLLTGRGKALPRQQTLRATIQWSYDHLTPEEQQLLRLLAVFTAGWTLAAAVAVHGDDSDEFEVLDLLTRLVHKSLVTVKRDGAREARYGMLETVRQYASELLEATDEITVARARHLEFFTDFMREAGPGLSGPAQGEILRQIDLELENLLAAHGWCDQVEGGAERGLTLVGPLQLYWSDRGLIDLGLRVYREALARPGAAPLARSHVLAAAGSLAFRQGAYAAAGEYGSESLAIAREIGDGARAVWALHLQGVAAQSLGDLDAAGRHYEEGIALAGEIKNQNALSDLYNALAIVRHAQGNHDEAARLYRKSLELMRELRNARNLGIVLLNLAQLEIQRGELDAAEPCILEGLDHVVSSGSKLSGRALLDTAAGLAAGRGQWAQSARLFGAADAALGWSGAPREPLDEEVIVPIIARTRAGLGDDAFEAAYAAGKALSYDDGLAEVRTWLGRGPTVATAS